MAVWAQMDERRLIEECRNGDRAAFRELFEAHKDRVHSIAFHFLGDAATAQDVTQEVFVKLFHTIGQFRGDSSFATWLHRIVVNACLNRQKRHQRMVPLEEKTTNALSAQRSDPEMACHETQLAQAVQRAVQSLKPELRMPMLLRYMEELSYAEIAETLGWSIGTVSSRLNRAHALLGRKLSAYRRELT